MKKTNFVSSDRIHGEKVWKSGTSMKDQGDAILVTQNERQYRARDWRLTQEVVDVVDAAFSRGLTANWVVGHPKDKYCNDGTEFIRGSHHITFARNHNEGWIFVLGEESKPPNFRFVTFNHRYGSFVHRTGLPYQWEHSGGHNIYIATSDLDAVLAQLTQEIIDEIEGGQQISTKQGKPLPRLHLTNESDLEFAFLDHLGESFAKHIKRVDVRPRYIAADGSTKIPDLVIEIKNGSIIIVELKFPHGIWPHMDQLQTYLRLPSFAEKSSTRQLHGILIARDYSEDMQQQVIAASDKNISIYRYGFGDKLNIEVCVGLPVLENIIVPRAIADNDSLKVIGKLVTEAAISATIGPPKASAE